MLRVAADTVAVACGLWLQVSCVCVCSKVLEFRLSKRVQVLKLCPLPWSQPLSVADDLAALRMMGRQLVQQVRTDVSSPELVKCKRVLEDRKLLTTMIEGFSPNKINVCRAVSKLWRASSPKPPKVFENRSKAAFSSGSTKLEAANCQIVAKKKDNNGCCSCQ